MLCFRICTPSLFSPLWCNFQNITYTEPLTSELIPPLYKCVVIHTGLSKNSCDHTCVLFLAVLAQPEVANARAKNTMNAQRAATTATTILLPRGEPSTISGIPILHLFCSCQSDYSDEIKRESFASLHFLISTTALGGNSIGFFDLKMAPILAQKLAQTAI